MYKQIYLLLFISTLVISCNDKPHHTHEVISLPQIDYQAKLENLGIKLKKPSSPLANYVNVTQSGKILFLAGKGPRNPDGSLITGKIGQDLTIEQGYAAARRVGILQLEVLQEYLGDLNKIKQILKVKGMVNAVSGFGNQPEVINGFSDFMVEVLGDKGKHARAAVGMASLPRNIAVEIDLIVEVY